MKGFKPLTLKEIKKCHSKNPQDKQSLSLRDKKLHETIEKTKINKKVFNKLIEETTKQEPFDKK